MLNQKFVSITLVAISFPCTTDTKTDYNSICTCAYPNNFGLTFERLCTTTDMTTTTKVGSMQRAL